jgi:hypothetical protein
MDPLIDSLLETGSFSHYISLSLLNIFTHYNMNTLGKPIGPTVVGHTVPTSGFEQGEHGAGTGLSGGVSQTLFSLILACPL